jgi:LacI family transcriptional regulator
MTKRPKARDTVTIIDIANAAGVSKSTVSLVLTGRGSVKQETRGHVLEVMKRLGYVYNRGAANLRNSDSKIGGIILCPALDTRPDDITWTSGLDTTVLVAIRRLPGTDASVVVPDNVAGSGRITRHLLNLGHERIAYIGGMRSMVVRQDRYRGFSEAMASAGHAVEAALNLESMPTRDGGFGAMAAALALSDRPTAVVCYNDVVAIGAMLAAARRGLVVGRDIAIVGFDDTSEARHVSPALTTVAVNAVGLGERAAALLLERITDRSLAPKIHVGPADLVIRESCGAHYRALAAAG